MDDINTFLKSAYNSMSFGIQGCAKQKSPTHVNTYKISKNCPNEIKTGQRLNEVFLFH